MEGESDFRQWDELVPDALGLIFKNLKLQEVLEVIPLVCKSWCKVVEGPYCWQIIDIYEYSKRCRKEQLDRMLRTLVTRSSGTLRELHVSCVNDDQMFSFIAEHAGSLQALTFRGSLISDSVVEQVAAKFSSLTYLDLAWSYLGTKALEAIGRNCKRLVTFGWAKEPFNRVYDNQSQRDEALIIARIMPQLKHLNIAHREIDTPVVLEILSGCHELEWLNIRGCLISDSVLEQVAAKFSSLTYLDLGWSYLGTEALEAIGRNCKRLVSFGWAKEPSSILYGKQSRRDEALIIAAIIARTMPQLKRLSIARREIDTPVVLEILSVCHELEWLDIRGCWDVKLDGKFLEEKCPKTKVVGPLNPAWERRSFWDEDWDPEVGDHEDWDEDWDQEVADPDTDDDGGWLR